ncbi:hypothetical protein VYU27_005460 [Nannochloropsis oceanica]
MNSSKDMEKSQPRAVEIKKKNTFAKRRKVTWGENVDQYDNDQVEPQSPLTALALSEVAQCHPIMASELIARACVGLIEAGNAHIARIRASMQVMEEYKKVFFVDCSWGLLDRLRDVLSSIEVRGLKSYTQKQQPAKQKRRHRNPHDLGSSLFHPTTAYRKGLMRSSTTTVKNEKGKDHQDDALLKASPTGIQEQLQQRQQRQQQQQQQKHESRRPNQRKGGSLLGPLLQARGMDDICIPEPMSSVVWIRQGEVEVHCSSAFSKVFLSTDELSHRLRQEGVIAPYVWGSKIIAREDLLAYYKAIGEVLYGHAELADRRFLARCISKTGQSILSLVRVMGGHNLEAHTGLLAFTVTPLPSSRYLRKISAQDSLSSWSPSSLWAQRPLPPLHFQQREQQVSAFSLHHSMPQLPSNQQQQQSHGQTLSTRLELFEDDLSDVLAEAPEERGSVVISAPREATWHSAPASSVMEENDAMTVTAAPNCASSSGCDVGSVVPCIKDDDSAYTHLSVCGGGGSGGGGGGDVRSRYTPLAGTSLLPPLSTIFEEQPLGVPVSSHPQQRPSLQPPPSGHEKSKLKEGREDRAVTGGGEATGPVPAAPAPAAESSVVTTMEATATSVTSAVSLAAVNEGIDESVWDLDAGILEEIFGKAGEEMFGPPSEGMDQSPRQGGQGQRAHMMSPSSLGMQTEIMVEPEEKASGTTVATVFPSRPLATIAVDPLMPVASPPFPSPTSSGGQLYQEEQLQQQRQLHFHLQHLQQMYHHNCQQQQNHHQQQQQQPQQQQQQQQQQQEQEQEKQEKLLQQLLQQQQQQLLPQQNMPPPSTNDMLPPSARPLQPIQEISTIWMLEGDKK